MNLAYSVIPLIRSLDEPLKHSVQIAFGEALAVVWQTMIGIIGIGLLASLMMKDVPLHTYTDKKWDVQEGQSPEAGGLEKFDSEVALKDTAELGSATA